MARTFYEGWISRIDAPATITVDQGCQFESHLFKQLLLLTGVSHQLTTAFHPQANSFVERLHRQLKVAIRCHQSDQRTRVFSSVLLGIRASWKEDLQTSFAELVYGQPLRLPGEFFANSTNHTLDTADFVKDLRQHLRQLRPAQTRKHGERKVRNTNVFKDLGTPEKVFLSKYTHWNRGHLRQADLATTPITMTDSTTANITTQQPTVIITGPTAVIQHWAVSEGTLIL